MGTTNPRYIARVLLNESKKDIITDIEAGFKDLLINHYKEMGNKRPDRIVYVAHKLWGV